MRPGTTIALGIMLLLILGGQRVLMTDIEIWELAEDGRFIRVQAYYEPLPGTPDYFLPTTTD